MRELPSGTVTFLFTDIEGSTRLLDALGDGYAEALAEHRRALREAFTRHGGVEVDTQGDAFFYAFERASDAIAASGEGQAALAPGPIRVRMGLHTGEPTVTEEGYVGLDVHRGARIAAAGHGGQVVLSEATARLVDAPLRDLGEHRLKDLTAPQRLYQLGDGEFPRLKTLYQTNLPVPATPFLGRERELAEVAGFVGRARLVTLTGAGGSGKTRLALQAAGAVSDGFPQGVWWVPLAPLGDPADVVPAAARALDARGPLVQAIGDGRLLLLLDNFEHVVAAAPELGALLEGCPNLSMLVTSRERLRLAGEQAYPVPVLDRAEACDLFAARARAVDPSFEPDESVDEVCERLDDLPLALELAAARTALLPPRELLSRLGNRLDLRGGRDADQRQATLRATIAWSFDLLAAEEQRLLAALSIFRGGWTLEAAEHVCDADLDVLQSLVEKSLIRRWNSGRFGMLETIREFAGEEAQQLVDRDALARRLAEHLIELGDRANLREEAVGLQRHELVMPEHGNVHVALSWALERGEVDLGLRLIWFLEHYWIVGDLRVARRWIDEFLARGPTDAALRARALRIRGGTFDMTGRPDLAVLEYDQAGEVFRELGEEDEARHILHRIASSLLAQDDVDRAGTLLDELLHYDRRRGRRRDEAIALRLLGDVAHARGHREDAIALVRESAEIAEEVGFLWWRALAFLQLADWLGQGGDRGAAEEALRQAAEILVPMGDVVNTSYVLAVGARIAAAAGEAERSGLLWGVLEAAAEREPMRGWKMPAAEYDEWLREVEDDAFERGRSRGHGLTPDEGLAALRREPASLD